MPRLQRRFPHAVELTWSPEGGLVSPGETYAARVRQPDDFAVVDAFVRHVRGVPASDRERVVLREVVTAAGRERVEV
jgi:exonuclease SbcD